MVDSKNKPIWIQIIAPICLAGRISQSGLSLIAICAKRVAIIINPDWKSRIENRNGPKKVYEI